ncbi:MAG: S8 family serine peptidase [Pyrinomonadaceae bacterium]|nr:S8 family serine peptidase [Pyrinomonadaceae bacterium]
MFGFGKAQMESSPKSFKNESPILVRYVENLTEASRRDKLSIGEPDFSREIKQITDSLNHSNHNNPILLNSDENKIRSVVNALAARSADLTNSNPLGDKQILRLDSAAIADGVRSNGELAERWKTLIDELSILAKRKRAVLFIPQSSIFIGHTASNPDVRRIIETAIKLGDIRVIGSVTDEETYNSSFSPIDDLQESFALINLDEISDTANASDENKTEREKRGFVGARTAPDVQEIIDEGGGRNVRLLMQVEKLESAELTRLLENADARVVSRIESFNTLEVEVPADKVRLLGESDLTNYLSPNRGIGSTGHVSKTAGLDAVVSTSGQSGYNGAGIGVAILDSGIDYDHSSLRNASGTSRIVDHETFVSGGYFGDLFGHGTHVASVAAGRTTLDGDDRFNGIAQGATIVNYQVLDAEGKGTTVNLLKALNAVLARRTQFNIRVVNISLGAAAIDSFKNDVLCRAVRKLVDHGIVVVVAAGNDGKDSGGRKIYGRVHSPGNEPSAITVGASNSFGTDNRSDDVVTSYSSRGPTRSFWKDASGIKHYDNLIKPDIVANGNKIISARSRFTTLPALDPSLVAKDAPGTSSDAIYMSGTSVSAPIVSGAVAIMLQANPNLTPNMVKAALQFTAQPLKNFNTLEQGAGQLNVFAAVQLAKLMRRDMQAKFVSDLSPTIDFNNGAFYKNRSAANTTIKLNEVTYDKGLGVQVGSNNASQIRVALGGNHQFFMADIGVDDGAGNGSVIFQVWVDGVKKFDSGVMTQTSETISVKVDVAGKNELKLIVTNANDGNAFDKANWAAARLTPKVNLNDNLLTGALPLPSSNIGTGDVFGWSQGILMNRTYASGQNLILKSQKVYGEGFLLGDGVTETMTANNVNTSLLSSGITLGTSLKISSGARIYEGANFEPVSKLLGDGVTMGDGIFGMTILINGDNTVSMNP